jgi:hypothetical protein
LKKKKIKRRRGEGYEKTIEKRRKTGNNFKMNTIIEVMEYSKRNVAYPNQSCSRSNTRSKSENTFSPSGRQVFLLTIIIIIISFI